MGSRGIASYNDSVTKPPSQSSLPTDFVQGFRQLLSEAYKATDAVSGRPLGKCIGVYVFYDYDGEPIYVGQTSEGFQVRVGRHMTGQRSDTVAYRILDPFEVAAVEFYPAMHLIGLPKDEKNKSLDALEYSAYCRAIGNSKYKAILNEKIPPFSDRIELPKSYRFNLIPKDTRSEREHPDVRIARRAETLARLAAVAHERGVVSAGLRRVIVIQAVRLADLSAARLAFAEGRPRPPADAIDVHALIGNVMAEFADSASDDED